MTIKKRYRYILILVLILVGGLLLANLLNISYKRNDSVKDVVFYSGHSDSWLATYSIANIDNTYYDSTTIQYLFDDKNREETIGPIEYRLIGNSLEEQSDGAQELQGVGCYHTGSIMNAKIFKLDYKKRITLTIKWKGKEEKITLHKTD